MKPSRRFSPAGARPVALADFREKIDAAEIAPAGSRDRVVDKMAATALLDTAVREAVAIFR